MNFYSQKLLPGWRTWLALICALTVSRAAWAEGTKQVAPSPTDSIVMLETNRPDFGDFASYGGPDDSRLAVTIANPAEILFIGLSGEHNDEGRIFDLGRSRYRFRIVNEAGTVVHGPFLIDNSTANVTGWDESEFGNYDVNATQNGFLIYQFAPGQAGDYFIEFEDVIGDGNDKVNIAFWDFTVARDGQAIPGRVWSKNWAFRTPPMNTDQLPDCEWDRTFNGVLYSYTTDGFVSRIDFNDSGFQGLSFNVAFNSTGPGNTGNLERDRQSIAGFNATAFSAEHKIFLNEPDPMVFPDGECGTIQPASTFSCADDGFCLEVQVSDPGQVEIVIDFNQNGVFDPESLDVSLVWDFQPGELMACVPWNGLRGDSSAVAFGDTVDLLFTYTRGVQHYAVYDAEFLKNGFCVETVRPVCGDLNTNRLYWDDRGILEESGTNQPKDGRGGCECGEDNCRTWTNFNINVADCKDRVDALTTGYGDKNTLNTWWYASSSLVTRANIPLLSCMLSGDTTICPGTSTELTVEVSGSFETFTYSWSGPDGFTGTNASTGPITVAGEYCVTVTNPVGCERVCCEEIVLGQTPMLSAVVTDATCDAVADGAIMASADGGSGQYEFSINGGAFQADGNFPALPAGEYEVVAQDLSGCTDTLAVTIGTLDGIDVDYPESLPLCFGTSTPITFTGDATGLSFSWEPTTGVDDPTSPNPTFSPSVTTSYTVTISNTASPECFIQDVVELTVSDNMNLQVNGTLTGCEPETMLTASGIGVVTYTWLDMNGDEIGTGETITLPLSGTVTYTLRGEDVLGCIQETQFTLEGGPVDVSLPDTVAICMGEEVVLEAINQDPGDQLTYSWTPANLFASGTDTASPDFIETPGVFDAFVTINNQFGCTYMDTVRIAIFDANATFDFTSEVQCDGATVVFTNTSSGAFGFTWDFGDGNTSTEVSPTHVYSQAGTYTVQLSSIYDASCVSTKTMQVMVTEPEIVADFTYDLTDCSSESATITFTDASTNSMNNTVSWMWTFSDGQISDEQNPTVSFTQTGNLIAKLTITSDNGCMAMVADTIDIQLVDLNLEDEEIALCFGDNVVLNPNGNPDYIYTWTPATGLDDPTAASPTASPTQTTQYTVTALNIAGSDTCAVTAMVTVTVSDPINFDLGDDITTCGEDAEITFTADVPVTVQWTSANEGDLGTGTSITVNPLRSDTIFAVATDAGNCTAMDTIVIIDEGVDVTTDPSSPVMTCSGQETTITIVNQDLMDQLTYEWSPAENIVSGADQATVTVVVEDGTVTFQAIVTNQFNCADTVLVDVNAVPFSPNLPDTVFVCAGTPTEINPDFVADYSYEWSPADGLDDANADNPIFNGDQTSVYYVTVTDNSQTIACEAVDSVVVFVHPDLNLTAFGGATACEPTGATLSVTTDVADATITWYDDQELTNVIFTGTPDQILTINDPLPTGVHVFTAVAEDPSTGCTDTSQVFIEIIDITNHLPPTSIDVCAGDTIELNPNGRPDLVYEWTPTDDLDLTTNGAHNPIFTGADSTSYDLVVSDTLNGCSVALTVMVNVTPPINLSASGDTTLCMAVPVPLTAMTDAGDITFAWYDNPEATGDPIATGAEVMVTPADGRTVYTVIASNAIGCTESDSLVVELTPILAEITPPQVFCEPTDDITIMVTNLNPEVELTYQWAPVEAVDPDQGPIVTVDPAISEDYSVTVTNEEGCELVLTTSVKVVDLSNLTISADPIEICLGESTTITVEGCEDCTYTWTGPGTIEPLDGPVVTVTPDVDGEVVYTVTVELDGCTETLSIPIIVTELICTSEYFFLPNAFTPNGDNINDELRVRSNFLDKITGFELQIYNRWGEAVFKTEDPLAAWDGTYKGKELPPDVYGFFMNVTCPTGEGVYTQGNISLLK